METIEITFSGESVRMECDLTQASALIRIDGRASQYRTADARHRTDWAVLLVARETWPEARWPADPRNGRDEIAENEAWDALGYAPVKHDDGSVPCTIEERGNGFPDVGAYVPGDDGELYRVTALIGRIQTGGSGTGRSNWIHAKAVLANWSDCSEEDEFPAQLVVSTEEDE
jgi:hypothetical protein